VLKTRKNRSRTVMRGPATPQATESVEGRRPRRGAAVRRTRRRSNRRPGTTPGGPGAHAGVERAAAATGVHQRQGGGEARSCSTREVGAGAERARVDMVVVAGLELGVWRADTQ